MGNENPLIPLVKAIVEIVDNIAKKASAMEYATDLISVLPAVIGSAGKINGATTEQLTVWAGEAADYLVGGADSPLQIKFPGLSPEEAEQLTDLIIKSVVAQVQSS
jgi:hypothetical protein